MRVKSSTLYACVLTGDQALALEAALKERNWQPHAVPHARFAFHSPKTNVVFYQSGKLVVQGKGTAEFVEFLLEPEILRRATVGYESILNPELLLPRIGVDESGKGDFFGPLSIAGVYVNQTVLKSWENLGVKDSKNISSDRRIAELAAKIRETPGCVVNVVPIGNQAYNRLYESMGSVNRILAWGHARVIENLMEMRYKMDPPPVKAISDQFASSKSVVEKALMKGGRQIELVQRHKAESDMAVAAASILARDEFVRGISRIEAQFGMKIPKGASSAVDAAAREFVRQFGAGQLGMVSKLHFRTAFRAQDLPEPPKKTWSRGRKSQEPT